MKTNNKPLPAYLKGAFLENYFFFDTVLGAYMQDDEIKNVFMEYARIFCIDDEEWLNDVFSALRTDVFKSAVDIRSFRMLSRVASFYVQDFSHLEQYLIANKLPVIHKLSENMFKEGSPRTCDRALRLTEAWAKDGDPDCLALEAFLEQNGVLIQRDRKASSKHIRKSAGWNHLFSLLMQLRYKTDDYDKTCLPALAAVLSTPSAVEAFAHICRTYGIKEKIVPGVLQRALEKAFDKDMAKRDRMSVSRIRVISSPVLSVDAKKELLLNCKDETLDNLPLKISARTPFEPITKLNCDSPLKREEERKRILANLSVIDVRDSIDYEPLLLICPDEYVLEEYERVLRECFAGRKIGSIDVSDPRRAFISYDKNNALVDLLNKLGEAASVVFVKHCETLDRDMGRELVKLIRSDFRKNYPLSHSPVTFDLSAMLPIMFSVGYPCEPIKEVCDIVELAPLSMKEFKKVVDAIVKEKTETFGLFSLSLSDDAKKELENYSVLEVRQLFDRALAGCRHSGKPVVLTRDDFIIEPGSGKHETRFWRKKSI